VIKYKHTQMEDYNEARRWSNADPKHSTRFLWKTYQILLQEQAGD